MRVKIPELRLALEGGFSEHHALLLRMLLDHIDHLTAAVDRLDAQVEAEVARFSKAVELLGTIPGLGPRTAWVILAEAGPDMTRFPSPAHLASWAGLCPGTTSRPANDPPGAPARATPRCAPRWWRPPGPRPAPAAPTWARSTSASGGASAAGARPRQSSPWRTPCW